ncbi:MAG: hydroxyacid dehydrogenase [Dermatophilaceae bacterium]
MILLALPADLVAQLFAPEDRDRMARCAPVRLSPSPADHHTPAARRLLATAEVIVTGWGSAPVDRAVLDHAPRLRAVVHAAGSVRGYAGEDCFARGVVVSSQAAANAQPVAEYTLAMILLSAKGVLREQRSYRRRRSRSRTPAELERLGAYGRRVGVIGASLIGRRVVELLAAFDLAVVVHDPTLRPEEVLAPGVTQVDLATLMRTCDVVSLHAPLLDHTRGMITRELLAAMKDGATFINTARGALVDQEALIDELRSGRLDAVVDVTDPEVPPPDSPWWELRNLTLTPHIAGSVGSELRRLGASAAAEACRAIRGESLLHPVTWERYRDRA